MAIYTQHGVPVKIIGRAAEYPGVVAVEALNDPKWVRIRHVTDLKGEDVFGEYDAAPVSYLVDEAASWKAVYKDSGMQP